MSKTPKDEQLVSSFLSKQQNNETPTAAETRAYQRALDSCVLNQLKSVTPSFFNRLFGIQNKQRFDWEVRYEFPCGRSRKAIDVTAVMEAIKHLIVVNRKSIGTGHASGKQATEDDIDINEAKRLEAIERRKKTEVQREKIQLELTELRRQQIPIEDVRECFDMFSGFVARLRRHCNPTVKKTGETVKNAFLDSLQRYSESIKSDDVSEKIEFGPDLTEIQALNKERQPRTEIASGDAVRGLVDIALNDKNQSSRVQAFEPLGRHLGINSDRSEIQIENRPQVIVYLNDNGCDPERTTRLVAEAK